MSQDKRPKVSICIPAYNNEAEVRRLLSSIAAQTMQDVEIILTDDSTNREIEALVEEIRGGKSAYAEADEKETVDAAAPVDVKAAARTESAAGTGSAAYTESAAGVRWNAPCMSRLRYVHNEKPLGHIFNWNKALSLAEGEYIKIMFSDDWFTGRDSLEKLMKQEGLLAEGPQQCRRCGTQLPPGGKTCPSCHEVNQ